MHATIDPMRFRRLSAYMSMSNLKITPTVSSFLTQKTLKGFHPARGMVMTHPLPLEDRNLKDVARWLEQLETVNRPANVWYPREGLVKTDTLYAILANRMGYDLEALVQGNGLTGRLGHAWTTYRQTESGPLLAHWVVGEAEILISVGTVGVNLGIAFVTMMLGNKEAHRLMQQFAADLRLLFASESASRVTADLDSVDGWNNLGFRHFQLAHRYAGVFESNCTMLLDADSPPSAIRLEDYLELMHSVELNIDSPQEKLGWATKSMTRPGQMILSAGKGVPSFRYEPNNGISWEVRKIIHTRSAERVQELMSLMFECEFKL